MTTTNTQLSAQDEKNVEEVMGLVEEHGRECETIGRVSLSAAGTYRTIHAKLRQLLGAQHG